MNKLPDDFLALEKAMERIHKVSSEKNFNALQDAIVRIIDKGLSLYTVWPENEIVKNEKISHFEIQCFNMSRVPVIRHAGIAYFQIATRVEYLYQDPKLAIVNMPLNTAIDMILKTGSIEKLAINPVWKYMAAFPLEILKEIKAASRFKDTDTLKGS